MARNLYATISVEKENDKKEVNIYKTKDQKYGIEVEVKEQDILKKVENITDSEQKIDKFLDLLLDSVQKFELLEDCVYEYSDTKTPIQWF